MTAIVFVFAVPEDAGSPGAVPWAVWSRQLPRLIVSTLNGEDDRGLRFFPFLGVQDGKRTFLEPRDQLPGAVLAQVHGQSAQPDFLIDGILREHLLLMRVHSGDGRSTVLEVEMPFESKRPFACVRRAAFELQGPLGLRTELSRSPNLEGDALRGFLLAKDALLALEASLLVEGIEHSIDLALQSFREDPSHPDLGNLLVETGRHLVRHGVGVDRVLLALRSAMECIPDDSPALAGLAELFEACRSNDDAVSARLRVAAQSPSDTDAVLAAGNGLFRVGQIEQARDVLVAAIEAGNHDTRVRAQLAACEEMRGQLAARDQILSDLADDDAASFSPGPARFVATWLIDHGRPSRAVEVLDRALPGNEEHAGLWLERGRANLGAEVLDAARRDLQKCLELRPDEAMRQEARRLIRLAQADSTLPSILQIERALQGDRLDEALRLARALCRERKDSVEAHLLLGVVRQRRNEFSKAIKSYRRSLRCDSTNAEAHNRLGILLVERGKPEEGVNHLRHAVDLSPTDASCWLHFAQGAYAVGDHEDARDAVKRAERIGTHDQVCAQVRERLELD
ncbi:MAG: tetratricopeptide repeat protein [Planctomycetota bacterium]